MEKNYWIFFIKYIPVKKIVLKNLLTYPYYKKKWNKDLCTRYPTVPPLPPYASQHRCVPTLYHKIWNPEFRNRRVGSFKLTSEIEVKVKVLIDELHSSEIGGQIKMWRERSSVNFSCNWREIAGGCCNDGGVGGLLRRWWRRWDTQVSYFSVEVKLIPETLYNVKAHTLYCIPETRLQNWFWKQQELLALVNLLDRCISLVCLVNSK